MNLQDPAMTALTHEFTETLPGTPERVFAALTDETELRQWFTEHAEIDLQPGGAFRFWGRHTVGTPPRWEAKQKVLKVEAPRLLSFSWPLHGAESEVTLELAKDADESDGPRTLVKGRHHFPEAPAVDRPLDLIDDLWRNALANLRGYLTSGVEGVSLLDYSDAVPRIRQSVLIDAPRYKVFHALIDPAALEKWIAAKAVVEPHDEGRYSYGWQYEVRGRQVEGGPTRILEVVENQKLVTDWPDWRGDTSLPPQRVTWVLESIGEQTRVTMIHGPFQRAADLSDYPLGWRHFLASLKKAVESA
jgi:uncharacterized protein YndB with AHSA1/START domain